MSNDMNPIGTAPIMDDGLSHTNPSPYEWVKDGPGPFELVPKRDRKARRAAAARARRSR